MKKHELKSLCRLYAATAIHAGTGQSTSLVDLPIQRERHTQWPFIQASGVKGAFRQAFRQNFKSEHRQRNLLLNKIFGTDDQDDWKEIKKVLNENRDNNDQIELGPAAIAFTDARLLAFPVRSNVAPFVWVTCPAVLRRLARDFKLIGKPAPDVQPNIQDDHAIKVTGDLADRVLLEEMVVSVNGTGLDLSWCQDLLDGLDRLLVVSDEVFNYAVTGCTEVQANIKIDHKTGTVATGSLRYQELLPADSLLYTLVIYSASTLDETLKAMAIKDHVEKTISDFIQIGGEETLGRGICEMTWLHGGGVA